MSILIIGGTGTLGRQIVKKAIDDGYEVRCLVRNLRRGAFLRDWGAELVYGDLSLPETLPPALKGINVVIDAATVRPSDDFNAKKIDWMGKVALIEASKLAEIKKFIFFSVLGAGTNAEIPLLDLKLQTEQLLKKSGIDFTVFQCSGFFQGLINQYAIPVLENQTVWLLGDSASIPYIDTQDAAGVVVESLKQEQTSNTTYALIGKKAWSSNEIVEAATETHQNAQEAVKLIIACYANIMSIEANLHIISFAHRCLVITFTQRSIFPSLCCAWWYAIIKPAGALVLRLVTGSFISFIA